MQLSHDAGDIEGDESPSCPFERQAFGTLLEVRLEGG